jgi:hemolysin III
VFGVGVALMFGASAGYHRIAWRPVNKLRMRRLDHSMIYVAIAGTYTPVVLVVLDGLWEALALAGVWAFVVAGVFVKLFGIDRLRVLGSAMYIVLGWSAVVGLPQILRELSVPEIALMFAGGLLYTGGAIVLATRRPDPDPQVFGYHEVWHAFTVAGWACHYVMVLLVLLSLR